MIIDDLNIIHVIKNYMEFKGIIKVNNCLYINTSDIFFLTKTFGISPKIHSIYNFFNVEYICIRKLTPNGGKEIKMWYNDDLIYSLNKPRATYSETDIHKKNFFPNLFLGDSSKPFFFDDRYPKFKYYLTLGLQISEIKYDENFFL